MAKLSDYFWWLKWVDKIIIGSFWWALIMAIVLFVPFLRVWWWVFFPLVLAIELRELYLWWVIWDYAYAKRQWVLLEIVPPKLVEVPLKAMEDVFAILWPTLYSPPNWRERWFEGTLPFGAEWISFEVASIDGIVHFYARVAAHHRAILESALYSHYPDLEIQEVPDYAREVPQNIPNEEWDVYGEDFVLGREAPYPIKTYEKFFETQTDRIAPQEKKIDSMSSLLEAISKLGTGEQYWLQFTFATMGPDDADGIKYKKESDALIAKLARRPVKKHKSLLDELYETFRNLILGPVKEGSGEKAAYSWFSFSEKEEKDKELVLTGGERDLIVEIENKRTKPIFRTTIRGVYVARRENWKSHNRVIARAYFAHFQTQHLNHIRFTPVTRPKTNYFFRKRIPFVRTRRIFRNYVLRFPPLFPSREPLNAYLNVEEMATIFHFPLKVTGLVFPTMARVESKKSGPPPNLPSE